MSMGLTPERAISHDEAWPLQARRQMMRDVIRLLSERGALRLVNAAAIATTYGPGITTLDAEAEMMKHLSEGEGK